MILGHWITINQWPEIIIPILMDCPIGKEDADREKIDCEPLIKINQWLKKNPMQLSFPFDLSIVII